jgi:hypothetical protein
MNTPALPRLAAVCGAIFAVGLFAANGSGNQAFSAPRAVLGIAALTLFVPFTAYLCSLLRSAEGTDGWLAGAALAAGVTGIALKLGSGSSELALNATHLAQTSQVGNAIEAIGNAATVLSLYPFAVFCAATAILGFRTRALPRWLSAGAGITAAALAVNGAFLTTQAVPAMLVFVLWVLVASVLLLVRASRSPAARHLETTVAGV